MDWYQLRRRNIDLSYLINTWPRSNIFNIIKFNPVNLWNSWGKNLKSKFMPSSAYLMDLLPAVYWSRRAPCPRIIIKAIYEYAHMYLRLLPHYGRNLILYRSTPSLKNFAFSVTFFSFEVISRNNSTNLWTWIWIHAL